MKPEAAPPQRVRRGISARDKITNANENFIMRKTQKRKQQKPRRRKDWQERANGAGFRAVETTDEIAASFSRIWNWHAFVLELTCRWQIPAGFREDACAIYSALEQFRGAFPQDSHSLRGF